MNNNELAKDMELPEKFPWEKDYIENLADYIETSVTFQLGKLYDVTIHMLTIEESNENEIIEQAISMVLCDIGIDINGLCKDIGINPYDKEWVKINKKN